MSDHPLTSSDRAEIFNRDTSDYPPEVKSAVFISAYAIWIHRVLITKKPGLAKTFFYKKKESEIFKKAENNL